MEEQQTNKPNPKSKQEWHSTCFNFILLYLFHKVFQDVGEIHASNTDTIFTFIYHLANPTSNFQGLLGYVEALLFNKCHNKLSQ